MKMTVQELRELQREAREEAEQRGSSGLNRHIQITNIRVGQFGDLLRMSSLTEEQIKQVVVLLREMIHRSDASPPTLGELRARYADVFPVPGVKTEAKTEAQCGHRGKSGLWRCSLPEGHDGGHHLTDGSGLRVPSVPDNEMPDEDPHPGRCVRWGDLSKKEGRCCHPAGHKNDHAWEAL